MSTSGFAVETAAVFCARTEPGAERLRATSAQVAAKAFETDIRVLRTIG
jgi:hypothetical protein